MTHDEILQGLYDHTLVGHAPEVKDLVNEGLADGMDPEKMLYDALIPSLEEVGARFERGDYFVPEMLIAARAMQGALDILRPLLAETGAQQVGTYVMGTVKGDVHDIGKNLVNIMLEGAGFTVHDLGVNVAPEKFIEAIQEFKPDVVGFSAFLTTTMPMFKANINALEKAGIRDDVIVMVGGAPVTQEYADAVGADGYASDASTAVRRSRAALEASISAIAATEDYGGFKAIWNSRQGTGGNVLKKVTIPEDLRWSLNAAWQVLVEFGHASHGPVFSALTRFSDGKEVKTGLTFAGQFGGALDARQLENCVNAFCLAANAGVEAMNICLRPVFPSDEEWSRRFSAFQEEMGKKGSGPKRLLRTKRSARGAAPAT